MDFAALLSLGVDTSSVKQAETALNSLASKGGAAATKLQGDLNKIAPALSPLPAYFNKTADTAGKAEKSIGAAAGQTGNLVSQFNDIAVMMAAGQSPVQLAMQQGTQISQVLTTMGGGVGAVKALGGAFVAMLNPISLITIGSIAMGAALSQSLSAMLPATVKFSDAMDSLNDAISRSRDNLDMFADSGKRLAEIYGGVTDEIREMASAIAAADLRRANDAAKTAAKTLSQEYNGSGFLNVSRREDLGNGLNLAGPSLDSMAALSKALGEDRTLNDRVEILERMRQILVASVGPVETMNSAQRDYYFSIVDAERAARQVLALVKDTERAESDLANAKSAKARKYMAETMAASKAAMTAAQDEISTLNQQAELRRLTNSFGADSVLVAKARVQAEREGYVEALATRDISESLKEELLGAWDAANGIASVDASGNITLAANETYGWADAMSAVRAEINAIASALASMGGGMISNASKFVELNALKQGKSVAEAARERQRAQMEAEFNAREMAAGSWIERQVISAERSLAERGLELDGELDGARDAARKAEREANKKPKSGGGRKGRGSGRSKETPDEKWRDDVADYQRETAAFLAQADALAKVTAAGGDWKRALAVIEEEQQLLNAAQKAGIKITPDLKRKVAELAEAHVDAEEKLERLRTATERGENAFKDLFGSILDGADAAKEALANLLAEIAKVQFSKGMMGLLGQTSWGSGLLQGIGNLLSFDGGGYTGDGARSGGLDGKGGFLAMMHPKETVTDHTKGQSGATSVHVTVGMDESGNLQVRKIAQQEAASMGQAVSASIPGRIQQYSVNPRRR
ncbi:phage tail length tape measure family protein [Paracoccus sp. (in: a-proteobacteria)]|uniref:phage tail length tape measure family protein n=1 Tax=Paracoccus sp. TaxID=267 RepID=UPI00289B55FB|nr:phage tail length tape measure family protein [Paracoccus sp. (in: a-proteobacteria)]